MSGDRSGGDTTVVGKRERPRRYGPCQTIRKLGSGGMGVVYLAEMVEERSYAPLGTQVAVKVLHPSSVGSQKAIDRFHREATLGTTVHHEAVVHVHEVATQPADGAEDDHFLIEEYVEGRTLRELVGQLDTLSEALARDLACQVAAGLQAIHDAGAVHRDVKPANILITPDHQVKLMDFGIAFLVRESAKLTATGVFVGSFAYAAPEQFKNVDMGPAVDQYSLGVVLHEAVTGRLPFPGDDFPSLMRAHLEDEPPKAGGHNPQVTPFFEEVITTLLTKDPSRRFASASELAEVLREGESSSWWEDREHQLRLASPTGRLRRIQIPRATELIGRDELMDELGTHYADTSDGRGRLVLIEGEAGVGKSRLVDEFVGHLEAAGEQPHVLYGSYPPGGVGGGPGALTRALVEHWGEAGLENALEPYLTAAPRLIPAFVATLTGTPPREGSEPLSAEGIHAVFGHLARALAAERPTVWIIEDLHFGTEVGRGLIATLGRIAPDHRLLLICTLRPELPAEARAQLEAVPSVAQLRVGRLSPAQVIKLLERALRSRPVAEKIGGKVAAKSDGNPFFVFEMVRDLKDGQYLVEATTGGYTTGRDLAELEVPSSVRDLLLARLQNLAKEERATLDVAAVQGHSFDPDLVARVRERKRLEVLELLTDLERRLGIVRATGGGFAFDHHQLQQVLHDALPALLRAEYHGMLAEAELERSGLTDLESCTVSGETAVFLVQHLLKGGRGERAAGLTLQAADHLAVRHFNDDVLEIAELALESIGSTRPELRTELRLREAATLDLLGDREAQQRAVDDAAKAAEEHGDRALSSRVQLAQGQLLLSTSDYRAARRAFESALKLAVDDDDVELQSLATHELGIALINLGEYEAVREVHERQLEVCAERGDRRGEADATATLGHVERDLGRFDRARELYDRNLEICRAEGFSRGEAVATSNLGLLYLRLGEHDRARSQFERQLELCREIGFRRGEASAIGNLGTIARSRGDLARARECFDEALAACREIGDRRSEAVALLYLGVVATDEGRLDEAREWLDRSYDLSRALGTRDGEAQALLQLGLLARARGDRGTARGRLDEALALFRDLGTAEGVPVTLLAIGRLLVEEDRGVAAKPYLVEAEEMVREQGLAEPGPLPLAYLAQLGERTADEIEISEAVSVSDSAEARLVLHGLEPEAGHLATARELLDGLCSHLDDEGKRQFWLSNPVARSVRETHEAGPVTD